jgi:hypothetical protein
MDLAHGRAQEGPGEPALVLALEGQGIATVEDLGGESGQVDAGRERGGRVVHVRRILEGGNLTGRGAEQ